MDGNHVRLFGYIDKFYRNCPKPDGWFGCFFMDKAGSRKVGLTGVSAVPVVLGGYYDIVAHEAANRSMTGMDCYEIDIIRKAPDKDAFTNFITSDRFPGIGPATADKIWNAFGRMSLFVIETAPVRVLRLGISQDKVNVLTEHVGDNELELLLRVGLPRLKQHVLDDVVDMYGGSPDLALAKIKSNPYRLLRDFDESGPFNFRNVDAMALHLGTGLDDERRISECAMWSFTRVLCDGGHTCLNMSHPGQKELLMSEIRRNLACPSVTDQRIWQVLNHADWVRIMSFKGSSWMYSQKVCSVEQLCVNRIVEMCGSKRLIDAGVKEIMEAMTEFEYETGMALDESQQNAVVQSLMNGVSVITGGPGFGKTTVIQCILYVWRKFMDEVVVMAGPTGLSVRKMNEQARKVEALCDDEQVAAGYTIAKLHVILSNHKRKYKDVPSFAKGTLVICDEASMVSLFDAGHLLSGFPGCQFVFIGDRDQLQPIGQGEFFNDLCRCDWVVRSELEICYRTKGSGVIAENARRINSCLQTGTIDLQPGVFEFADFPSASDDCAGYIVSRYRHHLDSGLSMKDICVICPMNKDATGVVRLNMMIQDEINPQTSMPPVIDGFYDDPGTPVVGSEYGDRDFKTMFRVGDRVMQTSNRMNGEAMLVNGDCGVIKSFTMGSPVIGRCGSIVVELDDGREEIIGSDRFDELVLAYAFTVHKSQGSEYKAVLFSAQPKLAEPYMPVSFVTKNLLYTAVTRAKETVEIIGSRAAVAKCCASPAPRRQSLFCDVLTDVLSGGMGAVPVVPQKGGASA